ncbi:hypothetical protein [Nocardiopsis listeri]|uniref:hypothetical protein n=1 Tax=Nocardiopsis listeri TaxID=53440 RepID=UPI000AFFEFF0|nr:hypothetical protein [Nocardiopsis listeri]
MRTGLSSPSVWALVFLVAVAGCGVGPSGVFDAGEAPTGVAPGTTLYFVDDNDELRPQFRRTERLGTVSDAVSLLLTGPGDSEVRTEIAPTSVTSVEVTTHPETIELRVPLDIDDVTPVGIDQIVCTARTSHVQNGGSERTRIRIRFVQFTPESEIRRTCPLYE